MAASRCRPSLAPQGLLHPQGGGGAKFKHLDGVRYDRYPIRVVATDGTGNDSEVKVLIGIADDAKPEVRGLNPVQSRVYSQDSLQVDVVAHDDRAVHAKPASGPKAAAHRCGTSASTSRVASSSARIPSTAW